MKSGSKEYLLLGLVKEKETSPSGYSFVDHFSNWSFYFPGIIDASLDYFLFITPLGLGNMSITLIRYTIDRQLEFPRP